MDLNEADLRDLAAFLARRMTTAYVPLDPTDAPLPGLAPAASWQAVLTTAGKEGWLRDVALRAAAVDPEDAALQEACRLLAGRRSDWAGRLGALTLVGAAVALMATVVAGMGLTGALLALEAQEGAPGVAIAASPVPTADDRPVVEPVGGLHDADDPRPGAVAPNPVSDPDGGEVAGRASRVEDGPPEVSPEPGAGPLVASRRRHLTCHGRPGEAVGYFYAGRHSPGARGEVHVVQRSVNVRVEYPSETNGWETRAPIQCVLSPGDRVTLAEEAIALPGGHYWVPVIDGAVEDGHVREEVAAL